MLRATRMLLLAVLVLAAGAVSAEAARDLPLSGTTERGQEWRLGAGRPSAGDDAPSSWCLKLSYTTGITVNDDRFGGGSATCGRRPARRASGMAVVDCERGSVFVFGATRSIVQNLRIRGNRGLNRAPLRAELPPDSGFRGRTFIAAFDTRDLPARLTADRVGPDPIVSLPARTKVCRPHPGAPKGGEPFLTFETRR